MPVRDHCQVHKNQRGMSRRLGYARPVRRPFAGDVTFSSQDGWVRYRVVGAEISDFARAAARPIRVRLACIEAE